MIPLLVLAVIAQEQHAVDGVPLDVQFVETKLDMEIAESVLSEYRDVSGTLPMDKNSVLSLDLLGRRLGPPYERALPTKDAWGHPLMCWSTNGQRILTSAGPDGVPDFNPLRSPGEPGVFRDDIVLDGGWFPNQLRTTMGILEDLGAMFESYRRARGVYPGPTAGLVPLSRLQELLPAPNTGEIETRDAWGNPIMVVSQPSGYVIVSWGSNGVPEGSYDPADTSTWPGGGGGNITPERDLIQMGGHLK
jgi:hypothetical protein